MTADSPALPHAQQAATKADKAHEHALDPDARELFEQATKLLGKAVRIEQEAVSDE